MVRSKGKRRENKSKLSEEQEAELVGLQMELRMAESRQRAIEAYVGILQEKILELMDS